MAHQAFFRASARLAEQGLALATESAEVLERLNDSAGLVFAYNSLVLISYYLNRLDQERQAADRLVAVARSCDDQWALAFALFDFGSTSFRSGDYDKAEQSLRSAVKGADEAGDAIIVAPSLLTLGHLAVARAERLSATKRSTPATLGCRCIASHSIESNAAH